MEAIRVIKDSDDEDDFLPEGYSSYVKAQDQPAQEVISLGGISGDLSYADLPQPQNSSFTKTEIDFTQPIQPSGSPQSRSLALQQWNEEIKFPHEGTDAKRLAGRDYGISDSERLTINCLDMETETVQGSLAQQPYIDDDDTLYFVPAATSTKSAPAGAQCQTAERHADQKAAGMISSFSKHGVAMEDGLDQANTLPTYDENMLDKDGYALHLAGSVHTSFQGNNYSQPDISCDIIVRPGQPADIDFGNLVTAGGDDDDEYGRRKPSCRSKSMQITSSPLHKMVPPKLSRARSERGWADSHISPSVSSEISDATINKPPKKKRSKSGKWVSQDQDQDPDPCGLRANDQDTRAEIRKRGQSLGGEDFTEHIDDIHLASSTGGVVLGSWDRLDVSPAATLAKSTQGASAGDMGVLPVKTDVSREPECSSCPQEKIVVKLAKPASRGSRKRKLKRGKTTSVTLRKTHQFDIEDDVIWVDDKPAEVNIHQPKEFIFDSRAIASIEAFKPLPAVEEILYIKQNPTGAQPGHAGPKKRGCKREKASEHMAPVEQEPTSAEGERPQLQGGPSTGTATGLEQGSAAANLSSKNTDICAELSSETSQPATSEPLLRILPQQNEEIPVKMSYDAGEREKTYPTPPSPSSPRITMIKAVSAAITTTLPELSDNVDCDVLTAKGKNFWKHSPIAATSRVPYRVGLSRRARIAPLLRVVRR